MTLSPDANFNVTSEQPVQSADYRGLANLASVIGGAVVERNTSTQGGTNSVALNDAYVRGMQRAQSLIDQGQRDKGLIMQRNVVTNFVSQGGKVSDVSKVTETISGLAVEELGRTDEQISYEETIRSPEYRSAWLGTFATNGDMTEEEREEAALRNLAVKEARQAQVENAQFDWGVEGETAVMAEISDFENTLFGGLQLQAQEGGLVSLEDAQNARVFFQGFRQQVEAIRPAGLPDDEWNNIRSRLDQTAKTLEYFEKIAAPGNLSARSMNDLMSAINQMEGVTDFERNSLLRAVEADTGILLDHGVINTSDLKAMLESLNGVTPDGDPPSANRNVNKTSDQVFHSLEGATRATGIMPINSPDAQNNWAGAVTAALADASELASRGEWMTSDQYRSVFSEQYFDNLDKIKESGNVPLYNKLREQTSQALVRSGAAIQARIDTVMGGQNPVLDMETRDGTITISEQSLRSAVPPHVAQKVIDATVEAYGGSVDEALNLAYLNNFAAISDPAVNNMVYTIQGMVNQNQARMQQLSSSMFEVIAAQRRLSTGTESNLVPFELSDGTNRAMPAAVKEDGKFMAAVANTASTLNADPNHLLRAMDFETAGTFDPSIQHAGSSAVGLIGFLKGTAKELGYTTDELRQMDRATQMRVVEQYLQPHLAGIDKPTFGDIYLAIHYPKAIGKGNDYVIYSAGSNAYRANKGLDTNGNGSVTAGEAIARAWGSSSSTSRIPDNIGELISQAGQGPAPVETGDTTVTAPQAPQEAPVQETQPAPVVEQPKLLEAVSDEDRASVKATVDEVRKRLGATAGLSDKVLEVILDLVRTEEDEDKPKTRDQLRQSRKRK